MTNNTMRKLWWVPALAMIAACDPFDDERGGTPQVLSVIGTSLVFSAGEWVADDAVVDEDGSDGYALAGVPAGPTVFQVKMNKLMDGASIQSSPTSCAPAAGLGLTVGGVAAGPEWHACYQPGAGSSAEGSSLIIYRGDDILPGVTGVGRGYFEASSSQPLPTGSLTIAASPKDKDGVTLAVSFSAASVTWVAIEHDYPTDNVPVNTVVNFSAAVTGIANQSVTWAVEEPTGCGSITAAGVYTAPAAVPTPDTCTIRATSVGDPAATETYEIAIIP